MNKIFSLLTLLFMLIYLPSQANDFKAVYELAGRHFPWLKGKVDINPLENKKQGDAFTIEVVQNRLKIEATSTSAASRALDWYVKHYAHQSISHMGNQIKNVSKLPLTNGKISQSSFVPYRYALNYCTINYSFSFYTWEDWEKELDWMALNGVNIMLAPVGTEMVWYNTLIKLGYSDQEAKAFIPGPAYTAWWLMGNLEGWGGPISNEMMQQQVTLQKKILARMDELGIEPILQGFYGMVPHDLKKKIADADVIDQGNWVFTEFKRPGIIVPTNKQFENVADVYYDELKKLYGSDIKYFGGEPFHEGGKTAGVDVPKVAQAVQTSMQKHFPNSTWVLQGWQNNPSDKILAGLKKENTLIIELFGENTNNWERRKGYNQTSFIWSNVSNFGEKNGLYGRLQRFIDEVYRAKNSEFGSSLKGVGIIPEGINNNPLAYDLMLDLAWHAEKPNLDKWIEDYTVYRYGKRNPKVVAAWKEFIHTVYNSPVDENGKVLYQEGPSESVFCARPSLKVNPVSSWGTRKRFYDIERFKKAVAVFISASKDFKGSETFETDKVDFLRQVMSDKADLAYSNMVKAIEGKDQETIKSSSSRFIQMLKDQDELLQSNSYFTLNRWLNQATQFGKGLPDAKLAMYNAKAQITFWGPDNNPKTTLRDYAHKEWGGLLSSLYLDRWNLFVERALAGQTVPPAEFYQMEVEWSKKADLYKPAKSNKKNLARIQQDILK
ncbi:alpha-N-acetylglucosaminidase [Sphingobacterium lactis]|uniref:alpha-N-acetylglucosaminidase n=1 Tax=Sphingobacterium lactis TaxID=797291 RepID=UPI003F8102CB